MYLLTTEDSGVNEAMRQEHPTLSEALTAGDELALEGVKGVRVWVLTHTIETRLTAHRVEHARGISGQ